jgi:hypothetical protein
MRRSKGSAFSFGRRPGSTVNDTPKLFLSAFDKHWGWAVTTGIFIDDVNALFFSRAIWIAGWSQASRSAWSSRCCSAVPSPDP